MGGGGVSGMEEELAKLIDVVPIVVVGLEKIYDLGYD